MRYLFMALVLACPASANDVWVVKPKPRQQSRDVWVVTTRQEAPASKPASPPAITDQQPVVITESASCVNGSCSQPMSASRGIFRRRR